MSDIAGSGWIHSRDRHVVKFNLESTVKITGETKVHQQLCVFLTMPLVRLATG